MTSDRPYTARRSFGTAPASVAEPQPAFEDSSENEPLPKLDDRADRGVVPASTEGRRWFTRPLVIGIVLGCVVLGAGAALATPLLLGQAPQASATPHASDAATKSTTLPGWSQTASWSATADAGFSATAGNRVLIVDGKHAVLRDADSGKVVDEVTLKTKASKVLAGTVSNEPALLVVTDDSITVWTGTSDKVATVPTLSTQKLSIRSGAPFLSDAEHGYALVTGSGVRSITPPSPGMIPIGASGESVFWASARQHVLKASADGVVASDVGLVPPDPAAKITAATGWQRAVSATTVIIGWTMPDGSLVTCAHDLATGAVRAQAPDDGAGFQAPDGESWITSTKIFTLATGEDLQLPEGFAPSQALGAVLYGQLNGKPALLTNGGSSPQVIPSPSITQAAVVGKTLLGFEAGKLVAFAPSPK